jgi:hypothetical protein
MARIMTDETSLTRRRGSLARESHLLGRVYVWEFAGAAVLLAAGALMFFLRHQSALLWAGGVLGIFGYGHYVRIRQNKDEEQSLEAGLRGESKTTKQLAATLDNSHYIFNDITLRQGLKSAQIDHLVVGPGGIFAVETKNWRGVIRGRGDEPYWWQVKYPGEEPIRLKSPVAQAERQASVVAQMLRGAGIDWPDVVPVVAFASTKTELRIEQTAVPVVHVPELSRAMADRPPKRAYAESDVDRVVQFLMKKA